MTDNRDKIFTGVLHPDGTVTNERYLDKEDIKQCPFLIILPDHYREDGSCRCDDPNHTEMSLWGYTWNGKVWTA